MIAIASARRATTLQELLDGIRVSPAESLYYHFWADLLQARFEEREYNNDFASWVAHQLHEHRLAEQLAVIDPTAFPGLEGLRVVLVETIEAALEESERLAWLRSERPFDFVRSQIVIFDTGWRAGDPAELAELLPFLPVESIFYHFIDARRREPPGVDDFSHWLSDFGPALTPLVEELVGVDYYFGSLVELRRRLIEAFAHRLAAVSGP